MPRPFPLRVLPGALLAVLTACSGSDPAPTPTGGLSRVDVRLEMADPYLPRQSPDDYRCFLIDWPETRTRYITGFRADPGNRAIVHHVIAYLATPAEVADYQARDDAAPGPGYTCFGGPGGPDATRATWLGGWAPGSLGQDFPTGTGLRIEPGSKVVLQVHYNVQGGRAAADRTAVAFKVDDTVEKVAHVQPWANPGWPRGTLPMRIPAGSPDTTHLWSSELTPYLTSITGGVLVSNVPVTVHSAGLHMHTRGTRIRAEVQWSSGDRQCLLDIPRWDFHWQGSYSLQKPVRLFNGDRLDVECHWDNSAPGATDRYWGEGTDDEMCLGIFYLTQ